MASNYNPFSSQQPSTSACSGQSSSSSGASSLQFGQDARMCDSPSCSASPEKSHSSRSTFNNATFSPRVDSHGDGRLRHGRQCDASPESVSTSFRSYSNEAFHDDDGDNRGLWDDDDDATMDSSDGVAVAAGAWCKSHNGLLMTKCHGDGSVTYSVPRYQGDAFHAINELRLEGSLCDVELVVDGEEIRAHKLILAACSKYFMGMFTRNMMEASSSRVEIREPSVTAQSLRTLVDFAYTRTLHVTQQGVQSLMVVAVFLQMPHVIQACSSFLEKHLDPSNCIGFGLFAALHGCFDLERKCKKYTEENFCEVVKYDEFLTLDVQDILRLVKKDELNIRCESEIYQAVLRWVQHDTASRTAQLEHLLSDIRLFSMAPNFLETQLKKCPLIRKLPRCMDIISDRLRRLTQRSGCVDKPRKPCRPEVIYSLGGFSRRTMDSLKSAECYDPRVQKWTPVKEMPLPRCGSGVVALKGCLYLLGGSTKRCGQCFDSCTLSVYDPDENQWSAKCSLSVPRNRVGVGVLDDLIYAVGGSANGEIFGCAERYDLKTDSWDQVAIMNTARNSAGVAVVNRLLYVVGGFDGVRRLRSVERYLLELNEWQAVESMNQARSGAGVAVMDGFIYAVGGYDGDTQLTSVERYDVSTNVWEIVAPMSTARSGLGVAVIGNKLYAMGGYDGRDFLSCVEVYNPTTDKWTIESYMLSERSGHSMVVAAAPKLS